MDRWFPGHLDVNHHPPHGDWCARSQSAGDFPARASDLAVLGPPAPLPPNVLAGRFTARHSARQDPVWPWFLAVSAYLSSSVAEPLKPSAPLFTCTITKVLTNKGFPDCSSSGARLVVHLGVRAARYVVRTTSRPSIPHAVTI